MCGPHHGISLSLKMFVHCYSNIVGALTLNKDNGGNMYMCICVHVIMLLYTYTGIYMYI